MESSPFFSSNHLEPENSSHSRTPISLSSRPRMSSNNIPGPKLRRKKNVKKGIQFCLMVCGASGTGRTTFVNTLCQRGVLPHFDADSPPYLDSDGGTGEPSVRIKPVTVELELDEEGTRVSLTIVDTPGFGDSVDNEASFGEISSYLERQYDDILAEESRIKRNPRFRDNRVHVLLYFVQPTGMFRRLSSKRPRLAACTDNKQVMVFVNLTSSSCAACHHVSTSSQSSAKPTL